VKTALQRIGDVLKLERRIVDIDPLATYELIGVYSFGKGIFHREPALGADLGAYKFSLIKAGDLVLSNIQAWEGAIALAGSEDNGCIGTHRFMTYVPVDDRADTSYLRYFFLSERGMNLIRKASPGSVVRNRTLGIEAFESLEVPLPSIGMQHKIADQLETVIRLASTGNQRVAQASRQRSRLTEATIQQHLDAGVAKGWSVRPLGEVASINPTPARLDAETPISFIPMNAVDATIGQIVQPEIRTVASLTTGYKQFCKGDLIFARITPCMQNGKTAVANGMPTEYGYGSTEFHVVRPGDSVTPDWLHRIFRTASFKAKAAKCFTGTAGQQRVPASFLREVSIPVPSIDEQRSVVAQVDSIFHAGSRLARDHALQQARFTALQASVLNGTFASLT
jgi:type I restriction enzyme S subunit